MKRLRLHAMLLLAFLACLPTRFETALHAQGTEKLPALAVLAVKTLPEQPASGDSVRFVAVVKNVGDAPTPEGVILGGVFFVDGAPVSYTAQYRHAVAPGETVELTASGGGGLGDGTWQAKTGSFQIGFLADDVNRIKQSDRSRARFTAPRPLVVSRRDGPQLVLRRLSFRAAPSGQTRFEMVAANIGTQAALFAPGDAAVTLDGQPVPGRFLVAALPPSTEAPIFTASSTLTPGRHTADARLLKQMLTRAVWLEVPLLPAVRPADSFADSVGVCVHLSYYDTTYGKYALIKQRLKESGIRYVRDGTTPGNGDVIGKMKDLAASGIRTDLIVDPRQVSPAQAVALVKALGPAAATVEGPNEPNLFYSDLFPGKIRDYQNALYTALKADPQTAAVPVLSPALAFPGESAPRLGSVACDFGALHPYPGGQLPDAGLADGIRDTGIVAPGKPLMTTETGYDTATAVTSGQPGVSEAAEAKYLPRLLLDEGNAGIRRCFLYEFADEKPEPGMHDAEEHFGLIRTDGTPKPALTAIARLIRLLSDPGPAFVPKPFSYTATGDATDLHQSVFEKRNGHVFLVLWVNARSYDQNTHADAAIASQPLTLQLTHPYARIVVSLPAQSALPLHIYSHLFTLTVSVPDEPLVIEMVPK
jgi:hypothetical protein